MRPNSEFDFWYYWDGEKISRVQASVERQGIITRSVVYPDSITLEPVPPEAIPKEEPRVNPTILPPVYRMRALLYSPTLDKYYFGGSSREPIEITNIDEVRNTLDLWSFGVIGELPHQVYLMGQQAFPGNKLFRYKGDLELLEVPLTVNLEIVDVVPNSNYVNNIFGTYGSTGIRSLDEATPEEINFPTTTFRHEGGGLIGPDEEEFRKFFVIDYPGAYPEPGAPYASAEAYVDAITPGPITSVPTGGLLATIPTKQLPFFPTPPPNVDLDGFFKGAPIDGAPFALSRWSTTRDSANNQNMQWFVSSSGGGVPEEVWGATHFEYGYNVDRRTTSNGDNPVFYWTLGLNQQTRSGTQTPMLMNTGSYTFVSGVSVYNAQLGTLVTGGSSGGVFYSNTTEYAIDENNNLQTVTINQAVTPNFNFEQVTGSGPDLRDAKVPYGRSDETIKRVNPQLLGNIIDKPEDGWTPVPFDVELEVESLVPFVSSGGSNFRKGLWAIICRGRPYLVNLLSDTLFQVIKVGRISGPPKPPQFEVPLPNSFVFHSDGLAWENLLLNDPLYTYSSELGGRSCIRIWQNRSSPEETPISETYFCAHWDGLNLIDCSFELLNLHRGFFGPEDLVAVRAAGVIPLA